MGKRVTLKDIATAAGVTTATVSYVLNDTPGQKIAPETRERVLKAARELSYVPNSAARTLRARRSQCVGVVAKKNLAVPRFSQTIRGIQSRLEDIGYNLLLCTNKVKKGGLSDYLIAYLEGRVDGIIFLGKDNVGPSAESVEVIERERVPFVAYDCVERASAYSTVDFDYRGGARLLAERVLASAPRRLLYIAPDIDAPQERQRVEGLSDALKNSPETELIELTVPITLDNLDTWDLRYYARGRRAHGFLRPGAPRGCRRARARRRGHRELVGVDRAHPLPLPRAGDRDGGACEQRREQFLPRPLRSPAQLRRRCGVRR